jgi:hypothetical protein
MDFFCGHPGAKATRKNIVRSPGLIFPGMEKMKNKMHLAKANFIIFMPWLLMINGFMSVTLLSVLTKKVVSPSTRWRNT